VRPWDWPRVAYATGGANYHTCVSLRLARASLRYVSIWRRLRDSLTFTFTALSGWPIAQRNRGGWTTAQRSNSTFGVAKTANRRRTQSAETQRSQRANARWWTTCQCQTAYQSWGGETCRMNIVYCLILVLLVPNSVSAVSDGNIC